MAKKTSKPPRLKLPARIRSRRAAPDSFAARMALVDRIADLRGIETVERNDETNPRRVEVYLQREAADRVLKRRPARLLCSLDCDGVIVSGLNRWERYQVLANGWGKLINDQVCVYLPRDSKELEIVWSVIRRAYDRMFDPLTPEVGSVVVSTWDWPKVSPTSLQ